MKNKVWLILVFGLLVIAPFVQSNLSTEIQSSELLKMPEIVSVIAGLLRWLLLFILGIFAIFNYKVFSNISKYNVLFACFYSVFFVYSVVSFSDIPRYFLLVLLTLIVPPSLTSFFRVQGINIRIIRRIISILIIVSFCFSYLLVLKGARFQGFLDNSNMYGITAVFWLAIFMLEVEYSPFSKIDYFFLIVIILSIFLSGSRGSLVAATLVIFLGFIKYKKVLFTGTVFLALALFLMNNFLDLDFIFDRFQNIESSAKDSGREVIWEQAYMYIKQNAWGWGMNAPDDLIGTGNMHSIYVRMLLMMGVFFTLLAITPLLVLLCKITFDKHQPKVLLGFLVGLLAASFGEDFIIGVGSSLFVYILFFISLLNYYNLKT